MAKLFNTSFLIKHLAIFLLLPIFVIGQIVCPKANIVGFDREHEIANNFVGENTTDIYKSKLYLTLQNDQLFIQSNFLPSNEFEYGIKMATPLQQDYNTLESYFENIYFFGHQYAPTSAEAAPMRKALFNDIEVIVDKSVLENKAYKK